MSLSIALKKNLHGGAMCSAVETNESFAIDGNKPLPECNKNKRKSPGHKSLCYVAENSCTPQVNLQT